MTGAADRPPAPCADHADWPPPIVSRLDPLARTRAWAWIAPYLASRRIDDRDALRRRLGEPASILCLGNGPSSEDPGLLHLGHDCLMRVNWRWRARRFLDRPDVVFVGDTRAVVRLRGCLFGFLDETLERIALLRRLLARGPRRIEYFTVRRICPLIGEEKWPARPSNGALMVAAAAALRPARLVIAGIDLYRHPDGAYPGEQGAANEYARAHRREVEVAIIARALSGLTGEVTIVGEPLRHALAEAAVPGIA
jgi:hypothetical protein